VNGKAKWATPTGPRHHENGKMLYQTGRILQLAGLLLLPLGMAGNLARPDEYGTQSMLATMVVGGVIFTIGYFLQKAGRPR
jgi:hypothetical protein